MIAKLTGIAEFVDASTLIVDVHGVGFCVHVPVGMELPRAGSPDSSPLERGTNNQTTLFIQTVVREDAIELYGFHSRPQHALFDKITRISGIGPRLALAILGRFTVSELVQAVESQDIARLTTIKGVGKKTAERLALELRGKCHDLADGTAHEIPLESPPKLEDVASALSNLGYTDREIHSVLTELTSLTESHSLDQLIRHALQWLRRSHP